MKYLNAIMLWLLLFAIPIQGFAATAMLLCKASHPCAEQATGVHAAPSPTAIATADFHQHHHASAEAVAVPASLDSGASDLTLSECGTCAFSCSNAGFWLGMAAPPMRLLTAPRFVPNFYIAFHIPGVDLAPPEHPPRAPIV